MLRVRLLLVRIEEGDDEERTPWRSNNISTPGLYQVTSDSHREEILPTVTGDIAHGVGPVLLLLRLAIIGAQLSREAAEHSIRLSQDLAVELDDRDGGSRVQLADRGLLILWVFVEAVADVFVRDAGILEQGECQLVNSI